MSFKQPLSLEFEDFQSIPGPPMSPTILKEFPVLENAKLKIQVLFKISRTHTNPVSIKKKKESPTQTQCLTESKIIQILANFQVEFKISLTFYWP